jgi:hypothetical protein
LSKENLSLSLQYIETGVLAPEISVSVMGAELQVVAAPQ